MANIEFEKLVQPITPESPCGPDLDLEGDESFLDFMANSEMALPSSFFESEDEGGRPFDRKRIDIAGNVRQILGFLSKTRDLRLLVLLARFLAFDRDLTGLLGALEVVGDLLETYWDEVHPQGGGDGFAARQNALSTLDLPTVSLPLQYTTICNSRRAGAISYRSYALATGAEVARDGESKHAEGAVIQAIQEAEPEEIEAARKTITGLLRVLERIAAICLQRGGFKATPNFDRHLLATLNKLLAFIETASPSEVPAEIVPEPVEESDVEEGAQQKESVRPAGAIRNTRDLSAALDAIYRYFSVLEPSSAVLPMVAQARALVGKNFVEAVAILVPDLSAKIAYPIGTTQFFPLPIERLSDVINAGNQSSRMTQENADTSDNGDAPQAERPPAVFEAVSRAQAINLMNAAVTYLKAAEPASPIPLLLTRGTALADKDFLSLLRSLLPDNTLKSRTDN